MVYSIAEAENMRWVGKKTQMKSVSNELENLNFSVCSSIFSFVRDQKQQEIIWMFPGLRAVDCEKQCIRES